MLIASTRPRASRGVWARHYQANLGTARLRGIAAISEDQYLDGLRGSSRLAGARLGASAGQPDVSGLWACSQAGMACGRGWAHQAVVAARWRPASLRSRSTAAAAAARAAPRTIKVICQPARPPAVITRTVGRDRRDRAGPDIGIPDISCRSGIGSVPAKAAGTAAADASRPAIDCCQDGGQLAQALRRPSGLPSRDEIGGEKTVWS